ncbi:MAG: hypothetical protein HY556_06515 [Euryarchaeota archaeon]|nr:hypothetical protein [Euryarchaeota archaeon]
MNRPSVKILVAALFSLAAVSTASAFSGRTADVDTSLEFSSWTSQSMTGRPGDTGTVLFTYNFNGNGSRLVEITPQFSGHVEWTEPDQAAGPFDAENGTGSVEIAFVVRKGASPGPTSVSMRVNVFNATRNATTNQTDLVELGSSALGATFEIEGAPIAGPPDSFAPFGVSPLVIGGGLLVLVGAAYILTRPRRRAYTPRSKALRETDEQPKRPREAPAGDTQQTSPEAKARKEVLILEAKRDDLRGQIEIARGRMERGEINEFVFNNLKKKKEEALAEVELKILESKAESREGNA